MPITASAAIRGCSSSTSVAACGVATSPASFFVSNTQKATSYTCPSRSCIWSRVTPAPRRNWRRCTRSAATPGSAPSARPRRRCATSPPNCSALYAQREARQGHAFTYDRTLYEQFAASFPFEETPDQLQAIEAVIADLASGKAMDRVVCGDVGFGKTEVALRAAFVAAIAGKQVALLVPTTLLAQQHYQNFRDRFADWPVRVEVISRFKSKKEIDAALVQLRDGRIDVMIGTHRLLQADIKFKDLGLVIVDEEQRFGVRQKEALKKLRAEVDLLTLTATPIPRTLNMAMSGLRDLSIIATPPSHRLAVKTFVAPYDAALVREAFQRELGARRTGILPAQRGRNDRTRPRANLSELIPDARLRIAHGQMPERELEQVMLDFYRQRFNVLVCTTIIESGIDVPSANTILINRADRFGLAQLHQLRGRVGRSHHRAYAYLIVPDRRSISADAEKRLEAIASLEELGAGFTLATHDLEIRGAGELLGEEQSGQIEDVGFSLYTELLERAVRALKSGKVPDFDLVNEHDAEVELHIPALIPDDYLPDVHARLTLYKRIASARDADALRELQVEMIDRFGLLPDPVKNLFAVAGAQARRHRDRHPQTRTRRKRRTHAVQAAAEHRPAARDQADPDPAKSILARRPGQTQDPHGAARRGRTHRRGADVAHGARRTHRRIVAANASRAPVRDRANRSFRGAEWR